MKFYNHHQRMCTKVFFIGCLSFLINCSTVYDISYDYNKRIDFTGLRTFDWMAAVENAAINNLDTLRIKEAVRAELKNKGLTPSSENPDFLIADYIKTKDKLNITSWGYDCGPYPRSWGPCWGPGGVYVTQYEEGTIILEFVDPGSMDVIWHGAAKSVVDDTMTVDERETLITAAVQKILKNFPPPELN